MDTLALVVRTHRGHDYVLGVRTGPYTAVRWALSSIGSRLVARGKIVKFHVRLA